jgi:hypothetical protein
MEEQGQDNLAKLKKMNLQVIIGSKGSLLAQIKIWFVLRDKVLKAQQTDEEVKKVKEKMDQGIETPFQMLLNGLVVMGRRIYLPNEWGTQGRSTKRRLWILFCISP